VVIVIGRVPDVGMFLVGGVPTSLRSVLVCALCGVHAQMSAASGLLAGSLLSKAPPSQAAPVTISATASKAPAPAMI
jgi:hypothetical protein